MVWGKGFGRSIHKLLRELTRRESVEHSSVVLVSATAPNREADDTGRLLLLQIRHQIFQGSLRRAAVCFLLGLSRNCQEDGVSIRACCFDATRHFIQFGLVQAQALCNLQLGHGTSSGAFHEQTAGQLQISL
uniref:Uncharacterized protein n=1 Tax=Knipowitschia caucasica TaxID=637954 RepID=A0AAV2M7B5_KNICA